MLHQFLSQAIAATPGLDGIGVLQGGARTARLVCDTPELGKRLPVEVEFRSTDNVGVLSLQARRTVEIEQELITEVVEQGSMELRQRWPDVEVRISNTRSGITVEYETRIGQDGWTDPAVTPEDIAGRFAVFLPRLRDCYVRSFRFINVLCHSSRVDRHLLECSQAIATEESAFIDECGGLGEMRRAIDELCAVVGTQNRDEVLARAVEMLRELQGRVSAVTECPVADPSSSGAESQGEADSVAMPPAPEPIGLTLAELVAFGPT